MYHMNLRQHFPLRYPGGGIGSSAFLNHQRGFDFWQVLNFWDWRGMWWKILGGSFFETSGASVPASRLVSGVPGFSARGATRTGQEARPTEPIASRTHTRTVRAFFTLLWTHQYPQPLQFVGTGIVRKGPIGISAALISNSDVGGIASAPVINCE
jgi:hypothetical protein